MTPIREVGFHAPARRQSTIAGRLNYALTTKQRPCCPSCSRPMEVRLRKYDGAPFWGCPAYPRCSTTLSIEKKKFQTFVAALLAPVVQRPEIVALAEQGNERARQLPTAAPEPVCRGEYRRNTKLPTQKDYD